MLKSPKFDCRTLGAAEKAANESLARKLVARKWASVTARKQVENIARSDRGFTCGAADYERDRGPGVSGSARCIS